jgi:hypothetical protein
LNYECVDCGGSATFATVATPTDATEERAQKFEANGSLARRRPSRVRLSLDRLDLRTEGRGG